MQHAEILFALFWIFVAAQIGAEIAQRLKFPAVVGEIAAGCIIGPSILNFVSVAPMVDGHANHVSEPLIMLAEVGAVLLLFSVGLETRLADLKKVGSSALQVGVYGLVLPFILGAAWAYFSGYPTSKSLFIAAAFVATSAGITARVLAELNVLGRIEARVILGAAVIDDILAMLLLGVVGGMANGQGISIPNIAISLLSALGFVALIGVGGTKLLKSKSDVLERPINPFSPLTLSLAACLGLAAVGSKIGLAPIIGAFLAGMAFAETPQRHQLEKQIQVIMAFITPFFFVVTGMQVELAQLASFGAVGTLLFITLLAVIGKYVGGYVGARSLGKKGASIVGVGMIPRGEVGIIVATLGRSANIFDDKVYALIIAMSLLTSIIAPPILKRQLAGAPPEEPEEGEQSHLHRADATGHG